MLAYSCNSTSYEHLTTFSVLTDSNRHSPGKRGMIFFSFMERSGFEPKSISRPFPLSRKRVMGMEAKRSRLLGIIYDSRNSRFAGLFFFFKSPLEMSTA